MAAYQYIYVMKGLTKIYPGGRKVLENIWLSFLPGAKIGVLGLNGAGKSTLLRVMAGEDNDFAGEAWAAEGVTVGFLPQEPVLDPGKDVLGNIMLTLLPEPDSPTTPKTSPSSMARSSRSTARSVPLALRNSTDRLLISTSDIRFSALDRARRANHRPSG